MVQGLKRGEILKGNCFPSMEMWLPIFSLSQCVVGSGGGMWCHSLLQPPLMLSVSVVICVFSQQCLILSHLKTPNTNNSCKWKSQLRKHSCYYNNITQLSTTVQSNSFDSVICQFLQLVLLLLISISPLSWWLLVRAAVCVVKQFTS